MAYPADFGLSISNFVFSTKKWLSSVSLSVELMNPRSGIEDNDHKARALSTILWQGR